MPRLWILPGSKIKGFATSNSRTRQIVGELA
jgi:hypothetical protein